MSAFQTQFALYGVAMALAWPWFLRDLPATVKRARARGGLQLLQKLIVFVAVAGAAFPFATLVSGALTSVPSAVWIGGGLTIINSIFGGVGWSKFRRLTASPY